MKTACIIPRSDYAVLVNDESEVHRLNRALQKREKEKGPFSAMKMVADLQSVVDELGFGEIVETYDMDVTTKPTVITAS